ncbi:MAG: phosphoribosylformylglycinamidine synthase, partial [Methanoregula sp.]|nr:phosphoribosylformylglycinamidine synthase [Methanoregula sp.]
MTSCVHRIEVHYKVDPRLTTRTDRIRSLGFPVEKLHLIDVYTLATSSRDFTPGELSQIGSQLINPVVQEYTLDKATNAVFDYAIEVGFLPGVTDNVGVTARQTIEDYFSMKFCDGDAVYTSQLFLVCGKMTPATLAKLASTLANPLVNRVIIKTRQEYGTRGMDIIVPAVCLHELPIAETVDLDLDDVELSQLGKEGILDCLTGQRRGPLALDLAQL